MNWITASRLGKIEEQLRKNYDLLNKFEEAKHVETHPRKLAEYEHEIERTRNEIEKIELEQNEILAKEAGVRKPGEIKESPPQIWHVPLRNRFFTGRKQVIERLHDALGCDGSVQVIRGLGGMGKTQTAVEYAYSYQNEYGSILWVRANSREALVSDLAALAQDSGRLASDI